MAGAAQEALAHLARGEAQAAVDRIAAACDAHDAEAMAVRALWRVEGKLLSRDLAAARVDLDGAAKAGHMGAARMLASLMAAGVGGPRDWRGALTLLSSWRDRDPVAARQLVLIDRMEIDDIGDPLRHTDAQERSGSPLVRSFPSLLEPDECALLVELGERRLRPAVIFHETQGRFIADPVRDSDAAAFPILSEAPFVHAINRRLAFASGTAPEQGEPLQLLRYRPGQQYRAHLDALPGLANQRVLTFLVYLSDNHSGGETRFTRLGIDIVARRGDALLFANSLPDGRPDSLSEHCGMPVRSGIKLLASRWIRQRPADGPDGFGQHEMRR